MFVKLYIEKRVNISNFQTKHLSLNSESWLTPGIKKTKRETRLACLKKGLRN
jgi:hypothetical protein